MLSWDELRSQLDRLHGSQASDDVFTEQAIDSYQEELLHLYDCWIRGL